ncbi:nicotinate-nucleotide--dimethylbenzimidazole phosphoribosyltransferase, partial [Vibrio parahaemolyticus]
QPHPSFIDAKQGLGTANYLDTIAMPLEQVHSCIETGKRIVRNIHDTGTNTIGFGEMGIGNTSSAALILSAVTGISIAEATGRGTGVTDQQLD